MRAWNRKKKKFQRTYSETENIFDYRDGKYCDRFVYKYNKKHNRQEYSIRIHKKRAFHIKMNKSKEKEIIKRIKYIFGEIYSSFPF